MPYPWLSEKEKAAVRAWAAATFRRRLHPATYGRNPARTFGVRTCHPRTRKTWRRALKADPCAYCGQPGPNQAWDDAAGVCRACNQAARGELLHHLQGTTDR